MNSGHQKTTATFLGSQAWLLYTGWNVLHFELVEWHLIIQNDYPTL
jgi:hypothetical protein